MSIVVPFLNESEGISLFCETLDKYAGQLDFKLELVFVDDGSDDDTSSIISQYSFVHVNKAKIVTLSKNYGSHAAIRAGVMEATYDVCTWMGSDLQEPIEFVKKAYDKISEGYDAVYIEKTTIKISPLSRFFSKTYSYMMRKYAIDNYSLDGVSNIVFNKKIKELLNENVESNSSIILQIMDYGFKYYSFSMDYSARTAGKSKWTFAKKVKVFIDSFVAFSFMPIRLVSIIGILIFILGIIIGLATIANKILNPAVPIGYSTLSSIMALGFGITNISLGIIAEYLWRAYDAARKRPVFTVSDVITIVDVKNE